MPLASLGLSECTFKGGFSCICDKHRIGVCWPVLFLNEKLFLIVECKASLAICKHITQCI